MADKRINIGLACERMECDVHGSSKHVMRVRKSHFDSWQYVFLVDHSLCFLTHSFVTIEMITVHTVLVGLALIITLDNRLGTLIRVSVKKII